MFDHSNIQRLLLQISSTALFILVFTSCKQESNFELLINSKKVPRDVILQIQYTGTDVLDAEDFESKERYVLTAHCIQSSPDLSTTEETPAENTDGQNTNTQDNSAQKQSAQTEEVEGIDLTNFAVHYDGNMNTTSEAGKVIQTVDVILPPLQKATPYCLRIKAIDTVKDGYALGKTFYFKTKGKRNPDDDLTHESQYEQPSREPLIYRGGEFWNGKTAPFDKINQLQGYSIEDILDPNHDSHVPRMSGWLEEVQSLASNSFPILFRFTNGKVDPNISPEALEKAIRYCEITFSESNSNNNPGNWSSSIDDDDCKGSAQKSGFDVIQIVDISPAKNRLTKPTNTMKSNLSLYMLSSSIFQVGSLYKVWLEFPKSTKGSSYNKYTLPEFTFLYLEDEDVNEAFVKSIPEGKNILDENIKHVAQKVISEAKLPEAISFAQIPISAFMSNSSSHED